MNSKVEGFIMFILVFSTSRFCKCKKDHRLMSQQNFAQVSVDVSDVERKRDLKISHDGVLFSETSVFSKFKEDDVTLRQLTNGKKFVQSVHKQDKLIDCDYSEDFDKISKFYEDFIQDVVTKNENVGNVTDLYFCSDFDNKTHAINYFEFGDIPDIFAEFLNLKHAKRACHEHYRTVRKESRKQKKAAKQLQKHHKHKLLIPNAEIDSFLNSEVNATARGRSKRSVLGSYLMFPGTKWCGMGDTALSYDDLGADSDTDSCCRLHDHCPYLIFSFTWNYGMFNYRWHTLTHCECDLRFHKCLQQSTSKTANLIGKIFFNIVGTKCIVFNREKGCLKRTWWGSCLEHGVSLKAEMRDQKPYV